MASLDLGLIPQHRFSLADNKELPFAGKHDFGFLPWMKDFHNGLDRKDHDFLARNLAPSAYFPRQIALNWGLLNGLITYWNPNTHTFFLPVGEMTLFQEEIGPLLGFEQTTSLDEILHRSMVVREHDDTHLRDIKYTFLSSPPTLNLRDLWQEYKGFLKQSEDQMKSPKDVIVRRKIILLLYGGIFLFTTPDQRLPRDHAFILARTAHDNKRNFTHPILAYLMAGLSSASLGNSFFGSPWLLQEWALAHFSGLSVIDPKTDAAYITKKPLLEWIRFFNVITDQDVEFAPHKCSLVSIAKEKEELRMIGALHLPLYTAHRCCRMLALPLLTVQSVLAHDLITPFALQEDMLIGLVEKWEQVSNTISMTSIPMDEDLVAQYCAIMRKLIPCCNSGNPSQGPSKRRRKKKE